MTDVVQDTATIELIRVREIVARISYRDGYRFRVDLDVAEPDSGRVFVQVQHWREDATNPGVMAWGAGGKTYLSPHATEGEILRKCFGAALAYEEHEVREFFQYRPSGGGEHRAIFGPHIDVAALWDAAKHLDYRS